MSGPKDVAPALVYAGDNGKPRVQVRISDGTVWLTQKQMADIYQVTVSAVNQHLANIYEERELRPEATIKKFLTVRTEGNRSVSQLSNTGWSCGPRPADTRTTQGLDVC
jgi:hypothetical protein